MLINEACIKTSMAQSRGWGSLASAAARPRGWILRYVKRQFVLALRPRDIVIMGNFGRRTSKAMRSAIKATGVRLSVLPPYSPNVIPIGQAFPGIKHWMHMARQRSMKDTWATSDTWQEPSVKTNVQANPPTQDMPLN